MGALTGVPRALDLANVRKGWGVPVVGDGTERNFDVEIRGGIAVTGLEAASSQTTVAGNTDHG